MITATGTASSGGGQPEEKTIDMLVQHWAKARIDVPLQLVARYDEAGKQLVTIGTALLTVFAVLLVKGDLRGTSAAVAVMVLSGLMGLATLLAALAVCWVRVDPEIFSAFELFRTRPRDEDLWKAIKSWCNQLRETVNAKRRYLLLAKGSLILGFLGLLVALFVASLR